MPRLARGLPVALAAVLVAGLVLGIAWLVRDKPVGRMGGAMPPSRTATSIPSAAATVPATATATEPPTTSPPGLISEAEAEQAAIDASGCPGYPAHPRLLDTYLMTYREAEDRFSPDSRSLAPGLEHKLVYVVTMAGDFRACRYPPGVPVPEFDEAFMLIDARTGFQDAYGELVR